MTKEVPRTQFGQDIVHAPRPHSRLPNECLYLIISFCDGDRSTLYSLLFVNKFFFHAALPLLMTITSWAEWHRQRTDMHEDWDVHEDDDLEDCQSDGEHGQGVTKVRAPLSVDKDLNTELEPIHGLLGHAWTRGDKLFALVLSSFFQMQLKGVKEQEEQEEAADAILKPFGMRLVRQESIRAHGGDEGTSGGGGRGNDGGGDSTGGAILTCQQMLRKQESNHSNNTRFTVDYSKYFTTLLTHDWRARHLYLFLQLRKLPEELHLLQNDDDANYPDEDDDDNGDNDNADNNNDDHHSDDEGEEPEHTVEQMQDH
ncbi:hypothetical protein EDD11_007490, partial [Mortierella claussenii]